MNDQTAKALVDTLGLTPAESLYLRAVAKHETGYGDGWAAGAGAGSNNMGAIITTSPDALSFKHEDSKFDPAEGKVVPYITWFAGYATPRAGFLALRDVLLKSNVKAALALADLEGAVAAQYMNGYFAGLHSHVTASGNTANVADYLGFISSALSSIYAHTAEVPLLRPKGGSPLPGSSPSLPPGLPFSRGDVVPDGDVRLRLLRAAMKGPVVRVWQKLLGAYGTVAVTGIFDAETEIATRIWQAKVGLPADGVVGFLSWSRMLS